MSNEELRAAIEAVVITGYGTAVATADPDAYAALYTEDAYWSPPDEIDKQGRRAIRATIAGWFGLWAFDGGLALNTVRELTDGICTAIGGVKGALVPHDGSDRIPLDFTVFWLVERQGDGTWLISNQFWTINGPPAAEIDLSDEA